MPDAPLPRPRGRPGPGSAPAPNDAELLAAALATFADHGYDGTSVRELCRQLGVSHNLVHQRYGSKEALWYAAVDQGFGALAVDVVEAVDPAEDDELVRLRAVLVRFLESSAASPSLLGIIDQEATTPGPRLDHIFDHYIAPVSEVVQGTLDRLAAEGRAHQVPAGAFHFLVAHGAGGALSMSALADRFGDGPEPGDPLAARTYATWVVDLLLDGIRPR